MGLLRAARAHARRALRLSAPEGVGRRALDGRSRRGRRRVRRERRRLAAQGADPDPVGRRWRPSSTTGWCACVEKKVPAQRRARRRRALQRRQPDGYNVIAEIPGHKKRDEVVMLGAHLDSWHAGTGATDNGAGSAVMLEAFRILQGARPADGSHRAPGAVERRGAGAARLARLREGALRRSGDDEAPARARQARRLLQPRQRQRQDPRHLPAGQRHGAADLRGVAGAVQGRGRDHHHHPQHRRHRPPVVRRRRAARLPVHPGPARLRRRARTTRARRLRSRATRRT